MTAQKSVFVKDYNIKNLIKVLPSPMHIYMGVGLIKIILSRQVNVELVLSEECYHFHVVI